MNRIGVECGGTFTDLIVFDSDGNVVATNKVFSTPSDPSEAVIAGLSEFDKELVQGAVMYHGSTVATNALIERKGAKVGFITTAGFEDVPFLQRQDREEMYNLKINVPQPLVERRYIRGITERISSKGAVRVPIDPVVARRIIEELIDEGVESIAVSLLHSYDNPDHENLVAEIIRECAPYLPISQSTKVSAEFREFERASTTIADAFLKPKISGYLRRLESKLTPMGISVLHVMQSNGGIVPSATAADTPISMLRSGPAAGVAGAISVAHEKGVENIVTLDMGGTSTDVAVVRNGVAEMSAQLRDGGLPINVSHVDIVAVGAGGGSIVQADEWGLLGVGPESAGADPGPISYGRGGTELTVTDINIMRDFLQADSFLGGKERLYPEKAVKRLDGLAEHLGSATNQLLEDAYDLVNVNMANAVRIATTERGISPASFGLLAYGGAGPLHAAKVAEELGMQRVVVPPNAGLASAYGLIAADFRREYSRTWFVESKAGGDLQEPVDLLSEQAEADLQAYGFDFSKATLSFSVDMRYRGQGFEISVDMHDTKSNVATMAELFNDHHESRYGHADRERPVQIVTVRLTAKFKNDAKALARAPRFEEAPSARRIQIFEGGERRNAHLWARAGVLAGEKIVGPAIVIEETSTTYVPSHWVAHVDVNTNLVLEREQA